MSQDASQEFRVLYLEDAFDQALLVKAFFAGLPEFQVTHVQDGDQALELIRSEPWHLLVTDLNLPGTDGFTVIRTMRSVSESVPILVTTGYAQTEYQEQALRAGADEVMLKPLDAQAFSERVRALVTGESTAVAKGSEVVLAIEGRLGDVEMGCGGSLMRAVEEGRTVVLVPLLTEADGASAEELKAASIAADLLGVEFRVDRTLFGNKAAQQDLLERTLHELRPGTLYLPAPDDRDPSRREASEIGRAAATEVETVLGYETATTGLAFAPSEFVDVHEQMVMKMEALAAYQSAGAPRVDLTPTMAQAYARYWGRFMEFAEVEAFEKLTVGGP